jgi:DNA-binding transcriptional MocR family regulator
MAMSKVCESSIAQIVMKVHAAGAREEPKSARNFGSWLRTKYDGRGYRPLREAIAHYLGSSRGVRCNADQVVLAQECNRRSIFWRVFS